MRDRATKALVSLFEGREDVLIRLLEKFKDVNDPYVAERLYAAAHGVALRSESDGAAERIAQLVLSLSLRGVNATAVGAAADACSGSRRGS